MADEDVSSYAQRPYAPPSGATEILLIRHGASQSADPDHPFPLLDGQGDPELAPSGREQAEQLADRLGKERIDAIYITTLRRTAQTAAPLATRIGLEATVEPDLREVHLGEWEGGLFRVRTAEMDPLAVRLFSEERWDVIPGAEPAEAFETRVRQSIDRIATTHPDGRVAVVTHGGVIAQALAIATKSRPFAFLAPDNASISRLIVLNGLWSIRGYNDISHLPYGAPAPLT